MGGGRSREETQEEEEIGGDEVPAIKTSQLDSTDLEGK